MTFIECKVCVYVNKEIYSSFIDNGPDRRKYAMAQLWCYVLCLKVFNYGHVLVYCSLSLCSVRIILITSSFSSMDFHICKLTFCVVPLVFQLMFLLFYMGCVDVKQLNVRLSSDDFEMTSVRLWFDVYFILSKISGTKFW